MSKTMYFWRLNSINILSLLQRLRKVVTFYLASAHFKHFSEAEQARIHSSVGRH